MATSSDVPGLCAEAGSRDALIVVVVDLMLELLVVNSMVTEAGCPSQ